MMTMIRIHYVKHNYLQAREPKPVHGAPGSSRVPRPSRSSISSSVLPFVSGTTALMKARLSRHTEAYSAKRPGMPRAVVSTGRVCAASTLNAKFTLTPRPTMFPRTLSGHTSVRMSQLIGPKPIWYAVTSAMSSNMTSLDPSCAVQSHVVSDRAASEANMRPTPHSSSGTRPKESTLREATTVDRSLTTPTSTEATFELWAPSPAF
mmetsp:Transcript_8800/g.26547  ORF Transcript_8800/g.26547 Transcript_8800/m.26547 type:complete len:206 (+) Transcript_8800:385-1002(+)